jgi:hypothetical protein
MEVATLQAVAELEQRGRGEIVATPGFFEIGIHIIEKIVHMKCNDSFHAKTWVYICKIEMYIII